MAVGFRREKPSISFGGIPKELLHRFSHTLPVSYPEPSETEEIYHASGITKMAEELGVTLDPEAHDWTGGMRSIERICTDLAVRLHQVRSKRTREVFLQKLRPWSGRMPKTRVLADDFP